MKCFWTTNSIFTSEYPLYLFCLYCLIFVLFNIFLVYFILTLLVYFLGLFLFVPRHQNSTKMEVEKIVQEKTEMQRHYVMVSTGQNSVHQMFILLCSFRLWLLHA